MSFSPEQRKNGTVIILGAGASYGSTLRFRPPIMNNFIKDGMKWIKNGYYDKLWKFLESIGYPLETLLTGSPNLEEIYSVLHIISSGLWHEYEGEFISSVGNDFWKIPPAYFLESFIMEVTNKPSKEALKKSCYYHDNIVRDLRRDDTIISFNYDLIADVSVWKNKVWSEYNGYGFSCYTQALIDNAEKLLETRSEVGLLKPHGSLNWWFIEKATLDSSGKPTKSYSTSLRSKLMGGDFQPMILVDQLQNIKKNTYHKLPIETAKFYDELSQQIPKEDRWRHEGVMSPKDKSFIVPPSLYKFGSSNTPDELVSVWKKVYKALSCAGKIVCIGYSFPQNDLEFNTLFRLALRNNEQKRLKILLVNPSSDIKERVQSLVPEKKVVHFADTLADYIKKGD